MQTPCLEQGAAKETKGDQEYAVTNLSQALNQAKCKRCHRSFKRERLGQKYCCARCRNAAVQARLRARSGDSKPRRRRLVFPQREAVTFGQKKQAKTKAIFDPLPRNFRRPVIDFLQRGEDLRRLVIAIECWNYPRYPRPPLVASHAAVPNGDTVEFDAGGFPVMPGFLRRV
jgi:hypothetical protein